MSGPSPTARRLPRSVIERELRRRSLAEFAAWAWPLVTGAPLVRNYATDALTTVLQAVADGELTRVLVAMPPGCGKSTELAVYSAWRLARDAGHRAIHASHAFDLAATESRRVRRLIEGDEYRVAFPRVVLREDESTVAHWATTEDGRYFAVGTDGALTGRRAHEAVLDDPLNAPDRFSKAARDALWAWFQEALSTRLDGDRAPIVVVQQRLDRDDLIGRLIESGGWTLVELPAEYDSRRTCVVTGSSREIWRDPRTVDGELLAPNVLTRAKLDALKVQIGAAAYATQYGQAPADDSSATVKRAWWRFHRPAHVAETTPRPSGCDAIAQAVETPTRFDRLVIACDLTFGTTTTSADYAVAQVWGSVGAARFLLAQWRGRATQLQQRAAIRELARQYPAAKILIERAAAGPGTIELLTADGLPNVLGVTTGGKGKAERLGLVSPTIEAGNCYLPLGASWLSDYVEELAGATKHDDAQDSTAYALADLNAHGAREWPEQRARREAQEACARGENVEVAPSLSTVLQCALAGVPLPGTSPRGADGTPRCAHEWLDAGHGTRCRRCGASPH